MYKNLDKMQREAVVDLSRRTHSIMQRDHRPHFAPSALEFPNVPYRSMTSPAETAFPSRAGSAPIFRAADVCSARATKDVEVANVANTYHVPVLEGGLTNHLDEKEGSLSVSWLIVSWTTTLMIVH